MGKSQKGRLGYRINQKKMWAPNAKERKQIADLYAHGIPAEGIASLLGVSRETYDRAWHKDDALRDEILRARHGLDNAVVHSLARRALYGKSDAAAIFWTKARLGWRTTDKEEKTKSVDENQPKPQINIVLNLPSNGYEAPPEKKK